MSIFILTDKKLKGGWRNLVVVCYTVSITWALIYVVLTSCNMITREGQLFMTTGFVIIGLITCIIEMWVHRLIGKRRV